MNNKTKEIRDDIINHASEHKTIEKVIEKLKEENANYKNKDGGITLEEIKVNPYWKKQPEAAAKMFKNKDKDANGKLSKEEFTAKPAPKKKKEGQPKKKKGADKKKEKSK